MTVVHTHSAAVADGTAPAGHGKHDANASPAPTLYVPGGHGWHGGTTAVATADSVVRVGSTP